MNYITCSSEMHVQTISCAQTFMTDERYFEWCVDSWTPFLFFDWGRISSSSGLWLMKFNYIVGFLFYSRMNQLSIFQICMYLSVRSTAGSCIRKIAHFECRSAEVHKDLTLILNYWPWHFVRDLKYLVWKFFCVCDWLSAHLDMWRLSSRAIRLGA